MSLWLASLAAVLAVYTLAILALAVAGRRQAMGDVAAFVPHLAVLFRGLLGDPRLSRRTKLVLLVAVLWVASPVDLIPEFIPIAGPLDDAIVAVLALRYVVRRAGSDVVRSHWRGRAGVIDAVLRLAGAP